MNRPFSSLFNPAALTALLLVAQTGSLAAGSLWKDTSVRAPSMFADKKAHAIGDTLTVIIQENNGATRNNSTSTAKKVAQNASITSFLYGPGASGLLMKGGQYPALNYGSANSFDGSGTIANSETITAQLAVRVIDVLPNGNFVIEGRRQTAFSGEKQDAILRGVVRADDVSSANTVLSSNIADATIQFVSKGTITDNTSKGWFTRIWDKVSPF
jgi:flagellar L-ring protein precursor FlgH